MPHAGHLFPLNDFLPLVGLFREFRRQDGHEVFDDPVLLLRRQTAQSIGQPVHLFMVALGDLFHLFPSHQRLAFDLNLLADGIEPGG